MGDYPRKPSHPFGTFSLMSSINTRPVLFVRLNILTTNKGIACLTMKKIGS
jgi:hypothetical protein